MSISTITINSTDYTAYASVSEADDYLAVDPTRSVAWNALSDDDKGRNLVAATRRLDLLKYSGEKADPDQVNEWPRTGATCAGEPVTSTDVPTQIEQATSLIAGSIALTPTQANAGTSGSNIKIVRAGSAEVEFFRPTIPGVALQDETAFALVRCLIDGASGNASLFGASPGTDGESAFEDRTAPGLSEGYT